MAIAQFLPNNKVYELISFLEFNYHLKIINPANNFLAGFSILLFHDRFLRTNTMIPFFRKIRKMKGKQPIGFIEILQPYQTTTIQYKEQYQS